MRVNELLFCLIDEGSTKKGFSTRQECRDQFASLPSAVYLINDFISVGYRIYGLGKFYDRGYMQCNFCSAEFVIKNVCHHHYKVSLRLLHLAQNPWSPSLWTYYLICEPREGLCEGAIWIGAIQIASWVASKCF